ncbi:hypothetical protein QWM81_03965 [Streptomyces ficellus]|uniref:Serine peptidase n=1 Tax=Streptomyces ficellus TaxID=1977088 RepID=A0ABT7Z170_9ACTN|nr:hypothetical protein [Streptomyces ficellus]MDN3293218.1 hypothetical protein [Streptomyces ficellus]
MGARVIYVHGSGNKVRPELLKARWDSALFGRDLGEVSRMAYWAPVRYESPLPDERPDPLDGGPEGVADETPAPVWDEPPEEFLARTLGEAWFESGGTAPEGPWTGEPGDPLGGWLRDMTYLADTVTRAEESGGLPAPPLPAEVRRAVFRVLVKHTFKDAHAYFFGGARAAIRDVVAAELEDAGDAPLLVVGHSLGSVVAYETLAEAEGETELFVTLGSPLGIAEVQGHLARPPSVPAGVRAWLNASDLRDLVALDHTLRPEYAPADRVTDVLVANDSGNHHGVTEYLSHPQVNGACRQLLDRLA